MTSYKPGQVSALLFASTKKVAAKDDNLAKLFSSPKSSKNGMRNTVLPSSSQVVPAADNIKKNNSSASKPKLKDEKREKKTHLKHSERQVPEEHTKKSAEVTAPFPYIHETLQQQKQADVTSLKPLKRKLEKTKTDDVDPSMKRPRRDRKRDKHADSRTVFVGNCPLTTDKKKLKKLFREFGEIETVRFRCAPTADPSLPRRATVITKNFHEQCNNFVSFVVFKEEEAAKKALVRNGYLLDDLHLRVDLAAQAKKHDKKRSVFVGNLPFTISEEVIRSHFSDCGDITNVRIVRDRMTNLGKGISYVQFESKDSVGLALKLNKTEVQGREIRVMVCTNKPKKKKDQKGKKISKSDKSGKPKSRKMSFAPSNVTGSKFQTILKTKKEKKFRKIKKKKETAKKQDGLSSIFGDMPAANKTVKFRKAKTDDTGKHSQKSLGTKSRPLQKGNSFKGKGNSFKGKGKGNSFKGKGKGISFKGKGNSFKGKGNSFKGKGDSFKRKGSSFRGKGKRKTND